MSSVIRQSYLVTSREFPVEQEGLNEELTKAYTDIANAVNSRTIGVHDKFQVVTGERWFNNTNVQSKRQTYRQVYEFGAITAGAPAVTVAHGISGITAFTAIYGTCITATPDYRPLPYASTTAGANIELNVDATYIYITVGAISPNVTSGIVVLEYLLN